MSSRERNMAIVLIALILLFGSVAVGYAFVYQPIQDMNKAADALDSEIQKKQDDYDKIKAERKRLDDMKHRSLPPDQSSNGASPRNWCTRCARIAWPARVGWMPSQKRY